MNGTEILDQIRAKYACLGSYHDKGEVVAVFTYASGSLHHAPHQMPFSTWFVRPDKFRFDFAHGVGHPNFQKTCSVWERDGTPHAHGEWTKKPGAPGRDRLDSLRNMLFYAGMHSHHTATRVPRLLLPERLAEGPELTARFVREESVANVKCHAMEVGWTNANGSYSETWSVGMEDSLIRKVVNVINLATDGHSTLREKIKADTVKRHAEGKISDKELMSVLETFKPENSPSKCESTTTYSATVNAPIADNAFDFHPDA